MTLTLSHIRISGKLPDTPKKVSVFELGSVSIEERGLAIRTLMSAVKVGRSTSVEVPFGRAYASSKGEVVYFEASGGVFARNAGLAAKFKDERRNWPGLETVPRGDAIESQLNDKVAAGLARDARGLLTEAKLLPRSHGALTVLEPDIRLDRFAHLDQSGKVITSGVGAATVHFLYEVEGIAVLGPGAKSQVRFEASKARPEITEVFHSLRSLGTAVKVQLGTAESILSGIVASDRALNLFHERGQRIQLTLCRFGYYALPVFQSQMLLLPTLQVEGAVTLRRDDEREFRFGRFLPVLSPLVLRKAGLGSHRLFDNARVSDKASARA